MERERWERVYRILVRLDNDDFRGVFRAAAILGVFFWAVIHDRPTCWACQRKNWPGGLWRGGLPSQSTMSRRLKRPEIQALLKAVDRDADIVGPCTETCVKVVDAKPLPVGGHSKDSESRWGHGVRALMKGYKLFAIWGRGFMPLAWRVDAMNISEQAMAERMMPTLRGSGGYVLGDRLYDINKLYDAAAAVGHQWVAQRKRPDAGLGHRKHSPARLRAIEMLKTPFGQSLYQLRDGIERNFGGLTNFGGGLAPLPNWVRRLCRVRLWVHSKLIINALRLHSLSPTAVA
jgi:hypothetical protein